jgi:hypothetical protein
MSTYSETVGMPEGATLDEVRAAGERTRTAMAARSALRLVEVTPVSDVGADRKVRGIPRLTDEDRALGLQGIADAREVLRAAIANRQRPKL